MKKSKWGNCDICSKILEPKCGYIKVELIHNGAEHGELLTSFKCHPLCLPSLKQALTKLGAKVTITK